MSNYYLWKGQVWTGQNDFLGLISSWIFGVCLRRDRRDNRKVVFVQGDLSPAGVPSACAWISCTGLACPRRSVGRCRRRRSGSGCTLGTEGALLVEYRGVLFWVCSFQAHKAKSRGAAFLKTKPQSDIAKITVIHCDGKVSWMNLFKRKSLRSNFAKAKMAGVMIKVFCRRKRSPGKW